MQTFKTGSFLPSRYPLVIVTSLLKKVFSFDFKQHRTEELLRHMDILLYKNL
jgi:hypothetical protein